MRSSSCLVLASASAVGADQLFGPPVRARVLPGSRPSGGRLDCVRAAAGVTDPAGGFPWGLRFYLPRQAGGDSSASNAVRCLQYGRVAGNTLGVLGEDGAFGNDGQFHALPSSDSQAAWQRRAFHVVVLVPASGFIGAGIVHRRRHQLILRPSVDRARRVTRDTGIDIACPLRCDSSSTASPRLARQTVRLCGRRTAP